MSADNEKRAVGFWWVKLRWGTVGWEVMRFEYGWLWRMGSAGYHDPEDEVAEWGPFLGGEPKGFLAAVVAYAEAHAAMPGGLSFEGTMQILATAGADTLRIVSDEGRRPA